MSSSNKIVGHWWSKNEPSYPMPQANTWDKKDAENFVRKLETLEENGKTMKKHYKGFSTCRICKCYCGSVEFSRAGYVWPEGFKHYISEHMVKPPQNFVDYVEGLIK